jgi:hypothetical protein
MKFFLDEERTNYIEINKTKTHAELTIKTNRDKNTSLLVTAKLTAEQIDKVISELVSIKVGLNVQK